MFRHPLRGIFLLLSVAVFAAASPARAVADITEVTLTVTIAQTTLGRDAITAQLRVEGTGLNNGTIALPSAPTTQLALDENAGVLGLDFEFRSLAELDAALPNGNYVLRVNNGNAEATIAYTRAAVVSPAISQPVGGSVVPPGPVEVLFTRCSICNQVGDSVKAVLENDMMAILAQKTLTSTSESWIPDDGMGADLELPELSAFVARVVHTAVRQANVSVSGAEEDGQLLFTNTFVQSDEVDFETGFHAPQGHFCLAANHPMPPMGCETITDPLLQVFDPSGMVSIVVAGHDVDYTVSAGAGGELTGSATADLDDNGSNETGPAPIKGKLGGGNGEISSKLSFSLQNAGLLAKLKVSVTDALSIPGNQLTRMQRASGSVNGTKIKQDASSTLALPEPLGWVLEFDLDADSQVQNAVLTLEGGRTFPLTGSQKFNFAAGESSLKLQSAQKGVSIQLKGLGLDDSTDPMGISGGDLSYRMLGQSGRKALP